MSNNTKTPVHPQIKSIIHNLDLDLGVELNRYEQSLRRDSAIVAQSSNYDNSSFYSYSADQSVWYQSAVVEEEEPIPVTSRLIEEATSWLDRILSPWGIFGIIIFFGANLFIFFNWDNITAVESSVNDNQTNFAQNTDKINHSSTSTTEKLPNSDNLSNSVATANVEISSPYPDLKTALFREIEQPQSKINNIDKVNQANPSVKPTQNTTKSSATNNNVNLTVKKYYLLSSYTSMAEFTRIKDTVTSAAIVNIDEQMKIQLVVVDNEKEAKTQSQQLKDKGIDNYLYSP